MASKISPDVLDYESDEEEDNRIISEEPQPDGSVLVKIKEKTSSGHQIRTLRKVKRTIQVRKGVTDRQQVLLSFVFVALFSRFFFGLVEVETISSRNGTVSFYTRRTSHN